MILLLLAGTKVDQGFSTNKKIPTYQIDRSGNCGHEMSFSLSAKPEVGRYGRIREVKYCAYISCFLVVSPRLATFNNIGRMRTMSDGLTLNFMLHIDYRMTNTTIDKYVCFGHKQLAKMKISTKNLRSHGWMECIFIFITWFGGRGGAWHATPNLSCEKGGSSRKSDEDVCGRQGTAFFTTEFEPLARGIPHLADTKTLQGGVFFGANEAYYTVPLWFDVETCKAAPPKLKTVMGQRAFVTRASDPEALKKQAPKVTPWCKQCLPGC